MIRGFIGFDGVLVSDDLSMQALRGGLAERATAALTAGCDVALHCNGRADEMTAIAAVAPALSAAALRRLAAAATRLAPPSPVDVALLRTRFEGLLVGGAPG